MLYTLLFKVKSTSLKLQTRLKNNLSRKRVINDDVGVSVSHLAALNRHGPSTSTDLPTSSYAAPSIGCKHTAAGRWRPVRGCWRWLILCTHRWHICLSVGSTGSPCGGAALYVWCNRPALTAKVDFLQNLMFVQLEENRLPAVVDLHSKSPTLSQVQNNKHLPWPSLASSLTQVLSSWQSHSTEKVNLYLHRKRDVIHTHMTPHWRLKMRA